MKHNIPDYTLQVAINEACQEVAKGPHNPMAGELELSPKDKEFWEEESPARLALAKAFLARLPEPEPPVVDGKTPGQVNYVDIAEKLCALGWTASNDAQWEGLRDALPELRNMLGGQASLEAAIARMEAVTIAELQEVWYKANMNGRFETIRARLIAAAKEGKAEAMDWKALFKESEGKRAELWAERNGLEGLLKAAIARAEKAEAELARIVAAATEAGWNGVENSKDLAQFIKYQAEEVGNRQAAILAASTQIDTLKAKADRWFNQAKAENEKYLKAVEQIGQLQQTQLSRLRPIAEAGPVPEGAVRVYYDKHWKHWGELRDDKHTHYADILPPEASQPAVEVEQAGRPDPYAELKA